MAKPVTISVILVRELATRSALAVAVVAIERSELQLRSDQVVREIGVGIYVQVGVDIDRDPSGIDPFHHGIGPPLIEEGTLHPLSGGLVEIVGHAPGDDLQGQEPLKDVD